MMLNAPLVDEMTCWNNQQQSRRMFSLTLHHKQNTKPNNNVGWVANLVNWNYMFELLKIELELGLIFGTNFGTKTNIESLGKNYN
jgi:hypothetical protein